jgi:hypothetical protein
MIVIIKEINNKRTDMSYLICTLIKFIFKTFVRFIQCLLVHYFLINFTVQGLIEYCSQKLSRMLREACYYTASRAGSIHSTPLHVTSLISVLILSYLSIPDGSFTSGFHSKMLCENYTLLYRI